MSTDKVSGDSRFDAGLLELAEDIENFLGLQNCTKPVRKMIADRLRRRLLPLLEKSEVTCDGGATLYDRMELQKELDTWQK